MKMGLIEILPSVVLGALIIATIILVSFLILVAWRVLRERLASQKEKHGPNQT